MGSHGNPAFTHSQNRLFLEDTVLPLIGSDEQFGTNEKLHWGLQGRSK